MLNDFKAVLPSPLAAVTVLAMILAAGQAAAATKFLTNNTNPKTLAANEGDAFDGTTTLAGGGTEINGLDQDTTGDSTVLTLSDDDGGGSITFNTIEVSGNNKLFMNSTSMGHGNDKWGNNQNWTFTLDQTISFDALDFQNNENAYSLRSVAWKDDAAASGTGWSFSSDGTIGIFSLTSGQFYDFTSAGVSDVPAGTEIGFGAFGGAGGGELLRSFTITPIVVPEPSMQVLYDSAEITVNATNTWATTLSDTPESREYVITNLNAATANLLLTNSPNVVVFDNGTTNQNGFTITTNIDSGSTNLAAGGTASFAIGFVTNLLGSYTGTVSIANNGSADPYTFSIEIDVLADPAPDMQVLYDGSVLEVGATNAFPQTAPDIAVTRTYTVTNLTTATTNLYLTGSPAVVFSENSDTNYNGFTIINSITGGATNLTVGGGAPFTIQFVTNAAGSYTGTVSIANTDTNKNPYTFEVTAELIDDTTPPSPSPMTFAVAPAALSDSAISMTATTASDTSSEPVAYLFTNTVNGDVSGWMAGTSWTNAGLLAGTEYTYQVKARDALGNETAWSDAVAATTPVYLALYQFDGGSYASTDAETHSTASDLAAGAGIDLATSSDDGGDPAAPALATTYSYLANSLSEVIGADDYYTFTITPGEYKQVTYEQILFNGFNSGGQNVDMWVLSSLDGFDAANVISSASIPKSTGWAAYAFDLSSMINDVSVAVTFRIYLTDNGASTGTHRIRLDHIRLVGSVTDAPIDNTPPSPNPMTFAVEPVSAGETAITMTATPATDDNPVQYYFAETSGNSGGSDSGWQTSTNYTDTGLQPDTTYSYTVKARDLSPALNTNTPSAVFSATTDPDGTPPSPDPMAFEVPPASIDESTITMTAALATDTFNPPVEYYIENMTNANFRNWSTDRDWSNTGLTAGQTYGYRVKARDSLGNETAWSPIATAVPRTLIAAYRFDGGSFASVDNEPHSEASDITNGAGVPLGTDATLGSPAAPSLALTMSDVVDLLADAIAADDYYTFTITPQTRRVDFNEISFRFYKSLGQDTEISVFSNEAGFAAPADMIGQGQLTPSGTFATFTVDLSGLPRSLGTPIEFRLYVTSGGSGNALRIDTIEITGAVVPLSPSLFRFR